MTENTYFEEMMKDAISWNKAKAERDKEREALKEKACADISNESLRDDLKAWDEKEKAEHPYPYAQGAVRALTAYDRSRRNGSDAFEIDDLPWDKDMEDFVKTLRAAGIRNAVVTDQSTGLMDGLYELAALGCAINGLKKVTRADDHRFGSKEPEVKNGIEIFI